MTNRRTADNWRAFAAWLAVAALLIDGLLPTAVLAALRAPAAAVGLCSAGARQPRPDRGAPILPGRHCALCAGPVHAWAPACQASPRAPAATGSVVLSAVTPAAWRRIRPHYAAAQPRAPPEAASAVFAVL